MRNLGLRPVFFVHDAPAALEHYVTRMGFNKDWVHEEAGRPFVFQVSLFGLQLIINQCEDWTGGRRGHGRVFVPIDPDQTDEFMAHVRQWNIPVTRFEWGAPTWIIHDLDRNELFLWLPEEDRDRFDAQISGNP